MEGKENKEYNIMYNLTGKNETHGRQSIVCVRACCDHPLGKLVLTCLTRVQLDFHSWLSWFCVDSHLHVSCNRERNVNQTIFLIFIIFPRCIRPETHRASTH